MRDLKRVNSRGVGKSRGYGFINFTDHKHALIALRATNNNPEIFGEKKVKSLFYSMNRDDDWANYKDGRKTKHEFCRVNATTFLIRARL